MLRYLGLICLALGFLLPSNVSAQEWAQKMFQETNHDFGTVARGAKVEFPFVFENLYLEDLHIESVRSSCGCTRFEYPKEVIKTYQKGTILAIIDTRTFLGEKRATLTVKFDKPFLAEVPLQVRSYIRRDVVLQPGVIRFQTNQGEKAAQKIAVSYAGRDDWTVTSIKSPWPFLETKLVEKLRGNGRVEYELWVGLTKETPVGYLNGQVTLLTNDLDPKKSQIPLVIEGQVTATLSVRPDSLTFLSPPDGPPMKRNLVVQANQPFEILSADCPDDRLEVTLPTTAKKLHLLPVTFQPNGKAGKSNAPLILKTDLGDHAQMKVDIFVEIVTPENGSAEKSPSAPTSVPLPTEKETSAEKSVEEPVENPLEKSSEKSPEKSDETPVVPTKE